MSIVNALSCEIRHSLLTVNDDDKRRPKLERPQKRPTRLYSHLA